MSREEPNQGTKEFQRWPRGEVGQTLVEYTLIIAFFSIVLIAALAVYEGGLSSIYDKILTDLAEVFGLA